MSIKLWDWLEELNWLVGADFPAADEDALWRCSDAWAAAAADLGSLTPDVRVAGQLVVGSLGGDAGAAFAEVWRQYAGPDGVVENAAAMCTQLASACDHTAMEVEYAKLQYIGALVVLGATLAALSAALVAGGLSALGMPAAVAAAQLTIRVVLVRLITAIAAGAVMNVGMDAFAQVSQLIAGHRQDWDLAKTGRAAEDGAIFGAVAGGTFLAAGRFAPGSMRRPVGVAVPLAVAGGIGGVAAPLAHGELPTGRDFLLALSSGVGGGLGPDLVHGRVAGEPSRLGASDRIDIDATGLDGWNAYGAASDLLGVFGRPDGRTEVGPGDLFDHGQPESRPATVDNGQSHRWVPQDSPDSHPLNDVPRSEDPGQLAGGVMPHVDPGVGASLEHLAPRPPVGHEFAAGVSGNGLLGAERLVPGTIPDRVEGLAAWTSGPGPTHVGGWPAPPASSLSPGPAARPLAVGPPALTAQDVGLQGFDSAKAAPLAAAADATAQPPGPWADTPSPARAALGPDAGLLSLAALDAGLTDGPVRPGTSTPGSFVDDGGWIARDADAAPLPAWRHDQLTLTGRQNLAADLMLERARAAEPRITATARDIAREVGGTLLGEKDRLKPELSLKSKLIRELGDSVSLSEAMANMKDTLRYTVGLPEGQYAAGAQQAVAKFLDLGFRPVSERQSWEGRPGYLGYNTFWSDPHTGHVFEIQFHTERSFVAKSLSHALFDEIRMADADELKTPRLIAKKAEHDAYFNDVPIPEGAAQVAIPVEVARYDPSGDLPSLPQSRSADGPAPSSPGGVRHTVTDAEALDLARHNAFTTSAGLGFYVAGDEVRDYAQAVHPTDGYVTVDLHGSGRGFQIGDALLTPAQFADALHELRAAGVLRLPDGAGIKLLSCDTAFGGLNSPAAVLAQRLGVEVVAPDRPVWTALDGDELVSSPTLLNGNYVPTIPPDGSWYRFIPTPDAEVGRSSAPGPEAGKPPDEPRNPAR